MLNKLLLSLRGSVCTYQGEELGLTEADIAQYQLQDPYGITFWPQFKGRDGCRTPMPWNSKEKNVGFSSAATWLPVSPEHLPLAVDIQEADTNSVLHSYRQFMLWRKNQPALLWGDIKFLPAADDVLMFKRSHEQQDIIAAFNFSEQPLEINFEEANAVALFVDSDECIPISKVQLAGYGATFAVLSTINK